MHTTDTLTHVVGRVLDQPRTSQARLLRDLARHVLVRLPAAEREEFFRELQELRAATRDAEETERIEEAPGALLHELGHQPLEAQAYVLTLLAEHVIGPLEDEERDAYVRALAEEVWEEEHGAPPTLQ